MISKGYSRSNKFDFDRIFDNYVVLRLILDLNFKKMSKEFRNFITLIVSDKNFFVKMSTVFCAGNSEKTQYDPNITRKLDSKLFWHLAYLLRMNLQKGIVWKNPLAGKRNLKNEEQT